MTDTPTTYPPPQIAITYSGGRYHVDVSGEEVQKVFQHRAGVAHFFLSWALGVQSEHEAEAAQ